MKIGELMTRGALTCSSGDTLDRAAQIMWERDCGAVPVTDERGRVVGVLTDRDICMAAFTQGRPLGEISVSIAASKTLVSASPDEEAIDVASRMQAHQVRRIPVTDGDGAVLGMIGLGDLARHVALGGETDGLSSDAIARTLAAISQPRALAPAKIAMGGRARKLPHGPAYHVRSVGGGWEVFDREERRVSEMLRTQGDAVGHAKELARRDGAAQVIVHRLDGSIASEFFYQRDERSALAGDDTTATMAASRPAHARRRAPAGPARPGR